MACTIPRAIAQGEQVHIDLVLIQRLDVRDSRGHGDRAFNPPCFCKLNVNLRSRRSSYMMSGAVSIQDFLRVTMLVTSLGSELPAQLGREVLSNETSA